MQPAVSRVASAGPGGDACALWTSGEVTGTGAACSGPGGRAPLAGQPVASHLSPSPQPGPEGWGHRGGAPVRGDSQGQTPDRVLGGYPPVRVDLLKHQLGLLAELEDAFCLYGLASDWLYGGFHEF